MNEQLKNMWIYKVNFLVKIVTTPEGEYKEYPVIIWGAPKYKYQSRGRINREMKINIKNSIFIRNFIKNGTTS